MELKVGEKCKQIKAIEQYGFDYVGMEFELTKVDENVVMGKGNGVRFGIERDKFYDYFELVKEIKDAPKFEIPNLGDITLKEKDAGKVIFKGSISSIINNNIKADTYEKGDILKITKGKLKDIEGTFIDYIEGFNKVLIQIDDESKLSVDSTNVMLSKKKVNNTHKDEKFVYVIKDLDGNIHNIRVRLHKNHTYITLSDGTKSRTSCHPNDKFDIDEGIRIAFFRAMAKRYTDSLEKLNV